MEERETHEIHTSERRSFRGCRLRWNWAYREGWQPKTQPKPLQFGIAFHTAMEEFYNPVSWSTTTPDEKLANAISMFDDVVYAQQEEYLEVTNQRNIPSVYGDDYQERIELGHGMLEYYARAVHPLADNWFRPILAEVPFRVPVMDPHDETQALHCDNSPSCGQLHPNPAPITYDGRVDAVVEDLQYGGYFAVDWKTASSLMPNDNFLHLDDQISSYVWALQEVLNINIKGFIYAEFRKDYPRPPQLLKKRYQGRLYSIAEKQITDFDTALAEFSQGDPQGYAGGYYDDYLEYLKSNEATKFHQRFTILQSDTKLFNVARNIGLETMDMVNPTLNIYPSVGRFTCNTCAFRAPCLSRFEGENYAYTLNSMYERTKN